MAWRQPGDEPLSESMMVSLLTHICITQPQWVNNTLRPRQNKCHFETAFSELISSMKNVIHVIEFKERVQLTMSQHWFRWWLGAEQATSYDLNQLWPSLLTLICITWTQWVTHWGENKMADVLQMAFSNAFTWMKIFMKFFLTLVQSMAEVDTKVDCIFQNNRKNLPWMIIQQ